MNERLAAFVLAGGFEPAQISYTSSFGDTSELMDQLAHLALCGIKRATTLLLRCYAIDGERAPIANQLFLIIGSECLPRAVARVTRVDVKPFRAIDSTDAWDEREGDRRLEYWRAAHIEYFAPETSRAGLTFREDDEVAFCRFEVLWPSVSG
ncbi:MAG: ASCH domain-containing protein [Candidatus Eremiobacteraeota bacterium]|nr:ASCH domain-containing protein [Candidatus Eremiobacteraeota bacterium]